MNFGIPLTSIKNRHEEFDQSRQIQKLQIKPNTYTCSPFKNSSVSSTISKTKEVKQKEEMSINNDLECVFVESQLDSSIRPDPM
jgi:hypothetical protein